MPKAKSVLKKNTQGYGYKYTDLSSIHQYLEENGQRYTQRVETVFNPITGEPYDYIFTQKYSKDGDGWKKEEEVRGCRIISASLTGKTNEAQEQGSGITYARRYSLLLAYGLSTDDDDAESYSRPKQDAKTGRSGSGIDFAEVRANMKKATSVEELTAICKAIPEPLKKYFVKDYEELKGKLQNGN